MMTKKKILIVVIVMFALIAAFFGVKEIRRLQSPKVTVLMYHHLTENPYEVNSVTITAERMDITLKWLSEHGYQTVLPRELLAISEGKDPSYYAPEAAKDSYKDFALGDKLVVLTFDDGYKSNYELLYPLLQKYNMKAEINVVCSLIGNENYTGFADWEQLKEMSDSGLVEIGSHSYNLHNPDSDGNRTDGINGIQKKEGETAAEFEERVGGDLKKSRDLIEEKLLCPAVSFAYPYGAYDKESMALAESLFPVTFLTKKGVWHLADGCTNIHRYGIDMTIGVSSLLQ